MLMRSFERLYRFGLHLCPRSFREDYGDEVAKDFVRLAREAGHEGGGRVLSLPSAACSISFEPRFESMPGGSPAMRCSRTCVWRGAIFSVSPALAWSSL
jgi:hypothetical protein